MAAAEDGVRRSSEGRGDAGLGTAGANSRETRASDASAMAIGGADAGGAAVAPARSLWGKTLDLSRECKEGLIS